MATTNDLKNGMVLNIDGQLWSVVEFQHVKPGKGGAFVRTKLKSVLSGKVVDRTFNAGTKVETANVDKRDMQYLYRDGSDFVFMDTNTYDQIPVARRRRRRRRELPPGEPGRDRRHPRGRAAVRRAAGVGRPGDHATPSRACRATARPAAPSPPPSRPATQIQVPLFLETGTRVKVDTRDGVLPGPRELTVAARSKARKRALDVLFEADQRGLDAGDAARRPPRGPGEPSRR